MSKAGRIGLFSAIVVAVLVVDQAVKAWTRSNLRIGQSWPGGPIPGFFELTLTYNKGVAFGALEGFALLAVPIALAITVACAMSAIKPNTGALKVWALALLASGAAGNLIDRVFDRRGVTDMFLVRLSNITGGRIGDFPVFNVADVAITFAVVLLGIVWLREGKAAEATESPIVAAKDTTG